MDQPRIDRLFLYGTLLPGLVRPPQTELIARLAPLGPATVMGRLYDLGPYPGLVLDSGATTFVAGELFGLPADPAVLENLDEYEALGAADPASILFRRAECTARLPDGRAVASWVYEYTGDLGRASQIESGDYQAWRTRD